MPAQFRRRLPLLLVLVASSALVAGCADLPTSHQPLPLPSFFLKEACYDPDDNHCANEPLDSDPFPQAPGYHIGPAFTMDDCRYMLLSGNADNDGLDDACEYRLAHAFAPLLKMSSEDAAKTREPYWAATYRPTDYHPGIVQHVSIIYLLSYHTDPGFLGHYGDSEFIIADVLYNDSTQHWELWQVYLSAHWGTQGDVSEYAGYNELEFPHHYRGYPRVYVAKNKHANYKSKKRCEQYQDTCPYMLDEPQRVEVHETRNIGSSQTQLLNTVASQNPSVYPGQESFWTANTFCGWWGISGCAGGYKTALSQFNF